MAEVDFIQAIMKAVGDELVSRTDPKGMERKMGVKDWKVLVNGDAPTPDDVAAMWSVEAPAQKAEPPAPEPVKEGWQSTRGSNTRVYHYIYDTMSLCRGLGFYFGELMPAKSGAPKGREDCAKCYRLLQQRLAKHKE